MIINFAQNLKDLDGNDINDEKNGLMTLGKVSASALLSVFPDEKDLSIEEKMTRNDLAEKTWKGGELDLTVDELAKIKGLVNKAFATRIVAQAAKMLEGK
jgi:hypothetical protein